MSGSIIHRQALHITAWRRDRPILAYESSYDGPLDRSLGRAATAIVDDPEGTGPIPMEYRTGPIDVLIDGEYIAWHYSNPPT